jgi:adenylate cyclase
MQFRWAVHVGEILADDDDIFGNTVNIAARLQEAAEPGGISLSGQARDAVSKIIETPLIDLGDATFKNITETVHHWRVDMGRSQRTALNAVASQAPSERTALAVLPFDNMSGETEQEYFSDGISEDIITALSRVRGLRVIARNSTFAYKGMAKDIRLIATELDARYVLEGSVRKVGNRVRINAQLIDATNGQHIWAERYDRELHDIFEVQDDITANIVNRTAPELLRAEGERVRRLDSAQLNAWDIFLQARSACNEASKDGFERAERLCQQAIKNDPNYAPAFTLLSNAQFQLLVFGYRRGGSDAWQEMLDNAEAATRLDPDEILWYAGILGNMGQFERALGFAKRGLEINPGYAPAHHVLGGVLYRDGQYEASWLSSNWGFVLALTILITINLRH